MSPRGDFIEGRTHKVLICEDEAIVAMDLQFMVEDLGFDVVGPCARISQGFRLADDVHLDAAVLDVRLLDGEVFPLAEVLRDKGVRLIFHSGHALSEEIRDRFPDASFCPKPIVKSALIRALMRVLEAEPQD